MNKVAGIKPFPEFDIKYLNEVKQTLLLFDIVGIPDLKKRTTLLTENHQHFCTKRYIVEELNYLMDNNLMIDVPFKPMISIKPGVSREEKMKFYPLHESMNNAMSKLKQKRASEKEWDIFYDAEVRFLSYLLNIEDSVKDFTALPIIKNISLPNEIISSKGDIIRII